MNPMIDMFIAAAAFTVLSTMLQLSWPRSGSTPAHGIIKRMVVTRVFDMSARVRFTSS